MRTLAECPSDVEQEAKNRWSGTLREEKGGVELHVSAASPFALHLLDADRLIPPGPRCDGVLVAESGTAGLTCFIELKGAIDYAEPEHPFEQIRGGIEHFAPAPNGPQIHGEEHHVLWRATEDLPRAPHGRGKPRPVAVASDHLVAGAIMVMRSGTRHSPRWMQVAGRDVFVAVIQKHGARGRIAMTLEEVEQALAL